MKQEEILDNKQLRDKLCSNVDVLEKVKSLLLIPEMDFMTVNQVAEYYSTYYNDPLKVDVVVTTDTLKKIYKNHKDEFDLDGTCLKSGKDFLKGNNFALRSMNGKSEVFHISGFSMTIPNRGIRCFPRRAILRIGMLLRDSLVAKEVRTQLLNIEEKTSKEIKVADINEEQKLAMSLGMAIASGNIDAIMKASGDMMSFKNRHIQKLETDNKGLAGEMLEWNDRNKLNAGVRKLASVTGKQFGIVWNELYKELQYKHGIELKKRGDSPYIAHIKEDEWTKVVQSFCAICESYNQSPTEMFQQRVMTK